MLIDTNTEFGARLSQRLQKELVIWLITVGADQAPHPRPVWFLWEGETFLIYSQPDTHKLRHIARNPNVALHLNSDEYGGDVAVFAGQARADPHAPPVDPVPAYLDKYREAIADLGMTPEGFAQSYSVPIRVTPSRVRGF